MKNKFFFPILVYSLVSIFLFYIMCLQVSIGVMTDNLMKDFNIGASLVGLLASFYFYSYASMQIPVGLLFDRFKLNILISTSIIVCAIGALTFGISEGIVLASAGRFLIGLGSSFAFVGTIVVAARWFHPKHFAFLVGITHLTASIGAFFGVLPLSIFITKFGWRSAMIFLAFFGFILSIFCFFIVRNPKDFTLKVNEGWQFLINNLKEVTKKVQNWWLFVYAFCIWGPVILFITLWGVPYLIVKYNIKKETAASIISMFWISFSIFSPIFGIISDWIGKRCTLLKITALLGFFSAILLLYIPNLSTTTLYIILFLTGTAAAGHILTFAIAKETNKPSTTATAVGFINMAVVIGGAILPPISGIFLNMFWDGKVRNLVPIYNTQDYNTALTIIPICFLISFITSTFFIKETFCKNKYHDDTCDML